MTPSHPGLWRVPLGRAFHCVVLVLAVLSGSVATLASTILPPDFDSLVAEADYIVHGRVKAVTCEWRTTESGRHIVTKVELETLETIAGQPPTPLVLVMLGGKIDDLEFQVDGAPKFKIGDEDILFVRGNGIQVIPFVAMEYGRYRIGRNAQTGRAEVARNNGVPLIDEKEISQPIAKGMLGDRREQAALTPEDFKSRIRASRQNHANGAR